MDEFKTPQDHREWLIDQFKALFRPKYDDGQRRHSGRLWKKNTSPMLTEEALDFISYVFTREHQLNQAVDLLIKADVNEDWTAVKQAENILRFGNPEGVKEIDN